jgi:alanine-glyoxylate transaminase/(R)-3-amino-2-methylpropionate-pyruvate transaminase
MTLSSESVVALREQFLSPSADTIRIYHDRPFVVRNALGVRIEDAEGKSFVDCTAQNLCISLAYGHPLTLQMVQRQVQEMMHCTTLFHHEMPTLYASELVAQMPPGDWVVHLVNSGAEAIDLAYAMARAATGNFEIISLRNGYHGAHFTALATTAYSLLRPAAPPAPGFVQVIHPDTYKGVFGADIDQYVAEVGRTIESATCGQIAGIVLEPVQGFGGVVPMPDGYMAAAIERVRAAGGVAIIDEVQTGFGRLGSHFWGFEKHGVEPDIVVIGKGMGNGMPIAGVIVRRDIAEAFANTRFFNTYGSNPVACASARSVLAALADGTLQAHVAQVGEQILSGLNQLKESHPIIGDVRGSGLLIGVELVEDRLTKAPATQRAQQIQRRLRDLGVIMVAGSATRNVLRINPPFMLSEADADAVLVALRQALEG